MFSLLSNIHQYNILCDISITPKKKEVKLISSLIRKMNSHIGIVKDSILPIGDPIKTGWCPFLTQTLRNGARN